MEDGGLIYRGYIKSSKITRRGALEMGWECYISQMKALTIFYPENSPFLQEKTSSNPPLRDMFWEKSVGWGLQKKKNEIMTNLLRKLCFFHINECCRFVIETRTSWFISVASFQLGHNFCPTELFAPLGSVGRTVGNLSNNKSRAVDVLSKRSTGAWALDKCSQLEPLKPQQLRNGLHASTKIVFCSLQ